MERTQTNQGVRGQKRSFIAQHPARGFEPLICVEPTNLPVIHASIESGLQLCTYPLSKQMI